MNRWYFLLNRSSRTILAAIGISLAVASAIVLRRGIPDPEVYLYIPHYLSERPLAAKIFDPIRADYGNYQARELSYLFDYLDCRFIAWGVDHGWPHFLSACHYVFSCAIAIAIWWFCRKRLRLSKLQAALLVLLFLTIPAVFLGGSYYRSAKVGATLGVMLCACCAAPAFVLPQRSDRFAWGAWAGTAGAALMAGLFDRQGFFLVLVLGLLLVLRAVLVGGRRSLFWAAAAVIPGVLVEIYNRALGPALIERFGGYRPSFDVQHLPWSDLGNGRILFEVLFYAPQCVVSSWRFVVGDLPELFAGLVLLGGWYRLSPYWPWPSTVSWTSRRRSWTGRLLVGLVPLALIAMYALMILRQPSVVNLPSQRIYYSLPSSGVFCILAALAVSAMRRHEGIRGKSLSIVLAILVASNSLALIEHRRIAITEAISGNYYLANPRLLEALRHLDTLPPPPPNTREVIATRLRTMPWEGVPRLGEMPKGGRVTDDALIQFFQQRRQDQLSMKSQLKGTSR